MTPLRLRYWDARLHAAVGALPDSPADRWLRRLSTAADHGRLWFTVALLLGLRRGPLRRGAVRGIGSLGIASAVANAVLKRLFGRVRPDLGGLAGHRRLPRAPHTFSFPSGHSASAGAFATAVALESPPAGALLAPLALAVGYSRVHVGVHYPGDVLTGLAMGAGVALAGQRWWPARPAPVRPGHPAPALPRGEGLVVVVVPPADGGPDPAAELRRSLPAAEVHRATPGADVAAALRDAARSGGARALGVAGDDAAVAAAAAVALGSGLPLAVVPVGAPGPLARGLAAGTPREAAAAVAAGRAVAVGVAEVDGVPFVDAAGIGASAGITRQRAALAPRLGRRAAAAVATARALRDATPVSAVVAGRPAEVWSLAVRPGPRGTDGSRLDVRCLRADVPFSRTRAVLGALLGTAGRRASPAELAVHLWSGPERVTHDGGDGPAASSFVFRARGSLTVYRSDPS